ncbi:MAG: hypothetical protein K5793_09765 [Nitrosarchaeum sp.]|nr:hypothetical protein [Nitrosarchaeum sp.]
MRGNLVVSGIIVSLFLIGVLLTTLTESFGEGWLVGLGLVALAAAITAITIVIKMRKK